MNRDITQLWDEEVWTVYGFIAYRVRSRADAEELTQGVFERALRSWERFDPNRAPARAWLLSIARNLLIDHYRSRATRAGERPLEEVDEDALGSVRPHDDLGIEPDLAAALATLSERDREVVALRFGGDLEGAEIAEITGLSTDNVHQIISRSLRRMREQLEAGRVGGQREADS